MIKRIFVASLVCQAAVFVVGTGFSQEKSLQKKDIPAAVLNAFQKSYPNATIKGFAKEIEDNKTMFEVESVEGKIHRDISYLADGTVVTAEETMPYASLPKPVRLTIEKEFAKAKVVRCEQVTKGSTIQFEFILKIGKKNQEVVLNPDGTVVKKEEKKEEKEENEEGEKDEGHGQL